MESIKIGIFDKEKNYVSKLCAYLNQMGNGKWNVVAFTDKAVAESYVEKRILNIFASTEEDILQKLKKKRQDLYAIWLKDQEEHSGKRMIKDTYGIYTIGRYAGAKSIGKAMEEIASQIMINRMTGKPMIAVYSPVGRCGKTSFALELVRNEEFGSWLYVGMEDYSFWHRENEKEEYGGYDGGAEQLLYYIKERQEGKVLSILEESNGIIPSAFSPFDTKLMEERDFQWLFEVIQMCNVYAGGIFDIGTGILQNLEWLNLFDYIVVPYLEEEKAMAKQQQLKELIQAFGMEELMEKMGFVNMGKRKEVLNQMEEIKNRGNYAG